MTDPTPPEPPTQYDGRALAKRLLRTIRAGALATLERGSGHPAASLITLATDVDGAPILLTSQLSGHTKNLDADPRCSVLLSQGGRGDPLAHPRLTLVGAAAKTSEPRVRARFLARQPKAALYADFPDFSFWRITIEVAHLNGGFAKAATLSPADLLTPIDDAGPLIEAEEGALAHMNEDHADALALYAVKLARQPEGRWRATGLDPEGLDLACNDMVARVDFPQRITGPGALRRMLAELASAARAS